MASDTARAAFQRAFASHQQGRLDEAEGLYREALRLQPNDFNTLYMLAMVAFQSGRIAQGVELTRQALAINPNVAEAHNNLANGLTQLGRPEEALASFDRAVALKPLYAEAHNNRGAALNALGRPAEAVASAERALALKPDYAEAHYNRGTALASLGRDDEALRAYDQTLSLRPDFPPVHNNRATLLHRLNRLDEALASCERALAAYPDYAEAHSNRGAVLSDLGRHAEALASYDRAIALAPERAEPHLNRSVLLLLLGRFDEAWPDYEWRKRLDAPIGVRASAQPEWSGRDAIAGKRILLHYEQGLGDTIQFCRYAPLLAERGAEVTLLVQAALKTLLRQLGPAIRVIDDSDPAPEVDFHAPLLSLPFAFGTRTETIPAAPHYLVADPALQQEWQAKLGPKTRRRIGLAWSGNVAQEDDRNRSMLLAELLPLLSADAEWFSLQKDLRDADATLLRADGRIAHFGEALRDFADTAALIAAMDLVIAVDTSVAHLAGALGKPVWIMLAANPAWRWQLQRRDSPWYPSARLFRQPRIGDWRAVIGDIGAALAPVLGDRKHAL